jgi:hypothetical protein
VTDDTATSSNNNKETKDIANNKETMADGLEQLDKRSQQKSLAGMFCVEKKMSRLVCREDWDTFNTIRTTRFSAAAHTMVEQNFQK